MSEKINEVFVIEAENNQQCDECGKIAELRPYGKNGACICFSCGMKDEQETAKNFNSVINHEPTYKQGKDGEYYLVDFSKDMIGFDYVVVEYNTEYQYGEIIYNTVCEHFEHHEQRYVNSCDCTHCPKNAFKGEHVKDKSIRCGIV